jgi:hypothetical protein
MSPGNKGLVSPARADPIDTDPGGVAERETHLGGVMLHVTYVVQMELGSPNLVPPKAGGAREGLVRFRRDCLGRFVPAERDVPRKGR